MIAGQPERGAATLARAALIVLALHFGVAALLRPLARPYIYSDFATFYSAARAFAEDRDPYDLAGLQEGGRTEFGGWIGRYFYPPPFAACFVRPLALLPFEAARRVWVIVEAAAYLAAAAILAGTLLGGAPWPRRAGMGFLALPFAPVQLDLKLGSVSGLLLLLLALFLRERRRERWTLAGAALAGAIVLKLSPALVLVYLALRGDWRVVWRALLALGALVLACLPWTGIDAYADYVLRVIPFLSTANFSWFTNQSVDAFFWRLFVPNPDTTPWVASPAVYRAATWTICAGILAGVAWLGLRARRRAAQPGSRTTSAEEDGGAWDVACILVASLLVARVTWEYMVVLALPCFALWLGAAASGRARAASVAGVALAFALCALPFPYTEAPVRSGPGLLLEAPRTYGLLLLYALTLLRLARRAHPS